MGLLQPESGLLFWMLLSFIVVFVILAKYGFPVITKMVEERRVFVEKSLEAAKEAKAQLDNIKTESEALLQQAREDQMKILPPPPRSVSSARRRDRRRPKPRNNSKRRNARYGLRKRPPYAKYAARSRCCRSISPKK